MLKEESYGGLCVTVVKQPKQAWKYMNENLYRNNKSNVSSLNQEILGLVENGIQIGDPKDTANAMNILFFCGSRTAPGNRFMNLAQTVSSITEDPNNQKI